MCNPLFKLEDIRPLRRVELHPATDEWMMGDRYGTVIAVDRDKATAFVALDASGRRVRLAFGDVFRVF